jgi:beta-glucosidase
MSERKSFTQVYLKGFEITLKSAFLDSDVFLFLNGIYASARKDLLTTVLPDEWGFKG